MEIIRASDPIEVDNLILVFYGQAGIGKTSLAFTAEKPLCLDFDNGIHRSAYRKDAVRVKAWAEVANITAADLTDYKTIILDTAGRATDFISAMLIEDDPKNAQRSGALTLQGYGALKSTFVQWLSRVRSMGKDVVIIAHDREDKQADDSMLKRPEITGGSSAEVLKVSDGLAYYSSQAGRRTLIFTPTDNSLGKDPAALGTVVVPDFSENPHYLADLIAKTKVELGNISEQAKEVAVAIEAIKKAIDEAVTPELLNDLMADLSDYEPAVKAQAWGLMRKHAAELGFKMENHQFVAGDAESESQPSGEAQAESTDDDEGGTENAGQAEAPEAVVDNDPPPVPPKKKAAKKKTAKKKAAPKKKAK